jgi:small conductance mechanosensitive channel
MVEIISIFNDLSSVEKILIALVLVIIVWVLSNFMFLIFRRFLSKNFTKHNAMIFSYLIQYISFFLAIYFGIYRFLNLDLSALAASLGIITVAVAFSSQQLLQNFIAGLIITIQRPIEIDDWVDVAPGVGLNKVKEIRLMRTILRDINGKINSMPNSVILASRLINYSQSGFIEIPLQVAVPYNSNREKIEGIMLSVLKSNNRILPNVSKNEEVHVKKLFKIKKLKEIFSNRFNPDLFQPKVYTSSIAYPKITLEMRFWIREINKKDEIVSEILNSLNEKLKQEKINVV